MGALVFPLILKVLLACFYVSSSSFEVQCETIVPDNPIPIYNLIPRFKMPPGNLLRYRIPQWEVLYFLKYGIVPFIFYDPNFNRTNFVSQVHKFKMYFNDGQPNRTFQSSIKDDASFREFLKNHGFLNFDQLPENALSENNKIVEEIMRAAINGNAEGEIRKYTPIDIFLPNFEPNSTVAKISKEKEEEESSVTTVVKKADSFPAGRTRQSFWNAFINRYPFSLKYSKSLLRTPTNFLMDHDPSWTRSRVRPVEVRRHTKSFRIGLRNVNIDSASEGGVEDGTRGGAGGSSEPRRGGKNFQTQGW